MKKGKFLQYPPIILIAGSVPPKGVTNGKLIKDKTISIPEKLDTDSFTTDMTKPKDLVNVEALQNYDSLVNTVNIANTSNGIGIYAEKINFTHYFKSLYSSDNSVSIVDDGAGGINLTAIVPEQTSYTFSNIAGSGIGVLNNVTGNNVEFKRIAGADNSVTVTENNGIISISANVPPPQTISINNIGTGLPLYKEGSSFDFRSIKNLDTTGALSIVDNTDTIDFNVDMSGFVPYVGATDNVDLNTHYIKLGAEYEVTGKNKYIKYLVDNGSDESIFRFLSKVWDSTNSVWGDDDGFGIGVHSVENNTGVRAIAVGQWAGHSNTGNYITALGIDSLGYNTGENAVGVGDGAASGNSGDHIVAVGATSLYSNTGDNTIGLGTNAGWENRGDDCIGIGVGSLFSNKGNSNIGIGENSLNYTDLNSSLLTSIGYHSCIATDTTRLNFTNSTAIGANSMITDSNQVVLGDDNITEVITSGQYNIKNLHTPPASATDTGKLGEIRVTSDYIYVCIATNTWVRAALTTW